MKITRDKMFFSKDLIHTMAYVGMFVAAIISVGACKSGIWVAAILAWIVAGIIIGLAIISDYKKAELLKNGTRIIGKVTATKRVHIKFHMSTYHLADENVIYPYVVHYQYKVKGGNEDTGRHLPQVPRARALWHGNGLREGRAVPRGYRPLRCRPTEVTRNR